MKSPLSALPVACFFVVTLQDVCGVTFCHAVLQTPCCCAQREDLLLLKLVMGVSHSRVDEKAVKLLRELTD